MSERMRVVAMDEDKEDLVVFQFVNDDAPGMYVFVKLNEDDPKRCCTVDNITGFPRYGNLTGSGMYVGNYFPQEKINQALELMEGKCRDSVRRGVEQFREDVKKMEERGGFKRLEEWDAEIMSGIDMIKKDELENNQYLGIAIF